MVLRRGLQELKTLTTTYKLPYPIPWVRQLNFGISKRIFKEESLHISHQIIYEALIQIPTTGLQGYTQIQPFKTWRKMANPPVLWKEPLTNYYSWKIHVEVSIRLNAQRTPIDTTSTLLKEYNINVEPGELIKDLELSQDAKGIHFLISIRPMRLRLPESWYPDSLTKIYYPWNDRLPGRLEWLRGYHQTAVKWPTEIDLNLGYCWNGFGKKRRLILKLE